MFKIFSNILSWIFRWYVFMVVHHLSHPSIIFHCSSHFGRTQQLPHPDQPATLVFLAYFCSGTTPVTRVSSPSNIGIRVGSRMLTTAWPSSVMPWLDVKFGIQVELLWWKMKKTIQKSSNSSNIKDDRLVCLVSFKFLMLTPHIPLRPRPFSDTTGAHRVAIAAAALSSPGRRPGGIGTGGEDDAAAHQKRAPAQSLCTCLAADWSDSGIFREKNVKNISGIYPRYPDLDKDGKVRCCSLNINSIA